MARQESELLRGLLAQARGAFDIFHAEVNPYRDFSHEIALVRAGSPGGRPLEPGSHHAPAGSIGQAPPAATPPPRRAECTARCRRFPWAVGCRPTAAALGLAEVSNKYLERYTRAVLLPRGAEPRGAAAGRSATPLRYLVHDAGGGAAGDDVDGRVGALVSSLALALLTERLLVVRGEGGADGLLTHFRSAAFPFHGSPSILRLATLYHPTWLTRAYTPVAEAI